MAKERVTIFIDRKTLNSLMAAMPRASPSRAIELAVQAYLERNEIISLKEEMERLEVVTRANYNMLADFISPDDADKKRNHYVQKALLTMKKMKRNKEVDVNDDKESSSEK